MSADTDVLVVGSGPSGVAAAIPLVAAGLRVWMVDGGREPEQAVPDGEYLALRRDDPRQATWLLGNDAYALRHQAASSPKLRAPTLAFAFRHYAAQNRIVAEHFALVGSLARGGLSNAWGCGVARFARDEWGDAPVDHMELDVAYAAVARRVGLSGADGADDLTLFFGVDEHVEGALALDSRHRTLMDRYAGVRERLHRNGFRLGRARLAVLARDRGSTRRACDSRGMCLWGCPRGAMYASRDELPALTAHANFRHLPGRIVERIDAIEAQRTVRVHCRRGDTTIESITARRVVLAAGTIASTAIAMRSIAAFAAAPLLHLPMAAFALLLPKFFATAPTPGPGIAQLAFTLDGTDAAEVCGFTFSTHGLPVVEFLRHAPLSLPAARTLFAALLPSCVVANCFLPARYARSRIERRDHGSVAVVGGEAPEVAGFADEVRRKLARAFRRTGAFMLPGSFRRGLLGADVHYAGTMPMRAAPKPGETDADGALCGLPGVHVADAAALPVLPAKSHTLAMMANAHRIGARLATKLLAATT